MTGRLAGKKIILGVTGGIAAYKTPHLVRLLKKEGAEVRVLMSPSASWFVTPETLGVVSGNPVWESFFDPLTLQWHNHVELGLWADAILIAPCTASTLSKLVQGQSDNLLVTVCMSCRCPVLVSPAMDLDMYLQESVQTNLRILASRGMRVIEPETGPLASGLSGKGRMPEPEQLLEHLHRLFAYGHLFAGKNVLITAGPTHEYLDAVRYLGNASSGKMGYALAETFRDMGAHVSLISGPVTLPAPEGIQTTRVVSATEMYDAFTRALPAADIIICAAAVADYRPAEKRQEKLKKEANNLNLTLVKNPDLLLYAGENKKNGQYLVGFALETHNEETFAREKLIRKKADLIVLNSLRDEGAGFGTDTNKVTLITHNNTRSSGLLPKPEIAGEIALCIAGECSLL